MSNLPYVGKLVEVAINRFSGYAEVNDLDEILQSAYKEYHSVDEEQVKGYDDLCTVDSKKMILMTLLDLSMAFDTVDHSIMMNGLERCFGMTGSALEWVKSYFSNRHQVVSINGFNSKTHLLLYGVPQGSLFGPFSFPKYTSPIGKITHKHNTTGFFNLRQVEGGSLFRRVTFSAITRNLS